MPKTLIAIILIGISIFLVVVFAWPNYQKFENVQAQVKNKETEIKYQSDYYEELANIIAEVENQPDRIGKINSALPDNPSTPSLLKFLQDSALENGLLVVQIGKFSIKASSDNPKIKETSITLILGGSYPAFRGFIKSLEKSSRMIEVEKVSFPSSESGKIYEICSDKTKSEEVGEMSEIFTYNLSIKSRSY